MALKIRLRKQGRTNSPFYRLVVADVRTRRDGKYLEVLGWYNPRSLKEELALSVNPERVQHWLSVGAELSESAAKLVEKAAPAVLKQYQEKHLALRRKLATKRRERRRQAHSVAQ